MDEINENKENEIFSKLESNKIISYTKNTNNKININFSLNEIEKECFSIIMKVLKKNNLNSVTCRVAGGWVRDKLLGKESDDIDILVDNIKADDLAKLINEELYPEKFKMGVIKSNPNKGKNIEVSKTIICNTSIDIVNLRTNYKNKEATPLSDAQYRDISINSLFYNINEQKVEDFSERGIKDLENGIIETPIEPNIALRDDPYIPLRMLRFAIKYKFKIANDINNYLEKNPEGIIEFFYNKVAKERMEKELLKILNLENSEYAIAYLYSFNMIDILFLIKDYAPKKNFDKIFLKTTNLYILGQYLLKQDKIFDIEFKSDNFNKIEYSLLLLTLYFRNIKDKYNAPLNQLILKNTYRTTSEHQKQNNFMCRNFDELFSLINENIYERLPIARALRKIAYKNIIPILLASIAYNYIENVELDSVINKIEEDILQKMISKHKKFFDFIKKEDILHIDKLEPLFSGKEIKELFVIKDYKKIGILKDYIIDEQIKDQKLNKNKAMELLKKKNEEIS